MPIPSLQHPAPLDATAQLLGAVAARVSRLNRECLADSKISLTFRQYRMLVRINAGCSSLTELANLANLSIPTVSEGVDLMVRRGLLSRTRRADDRRAYVLALTDKGREALEAGNREFQETTNRLVSALDEKQREQFATSLEIVYDAVTVLFRERFDRGATTATSE